jgi:hypothetical protein
MVDLQQLTCFIEGWRLGGQKFHIRASELISSISDSSAFTIGVGHEAMQQLSLLNP